ncbi:MAG TPA: ATP-binding protein [Desulfonatronum sp.]|nr:ATP-binding protein [Desulfonatronum sp.]
MNNQAFLLERLLQINPWIGQAKGTEQAMNMIKALMPVKYIPRQPSKPVLNQDRAVVIIGPRQAGKTTFAWHCLREFAPDVLYLNMEDVLLKSALDSPFILADWLRNRLSFIQALFIDEIQHMQEAGLFLKGLVDARLGRPILATGSSSFHLHARTRESLAGRAVRMKILPFSLGEMTSQVSVHNPLAREQQAQDKLKDSLIYGSYPAVHLADSRDGKQQILTDLCEALILRDASDVHRIQRIDAFRKLIALLAGQVGSLINIAELASHCQVDSGTVHSYLEILEESHIISRVRPYAGGKRREITSAAKVFFIDNGVRNLLVRNLTENFAARGDKGALLENWIFSELMKALPMTANLQYWRSKSGAEVDFVITTGNDIYAVEVKSAVLRTPKLSRSARSFIDAYQPQTFSLVNMSLNAEISIRTTQVIFLTPPAFAAALQAEPPWGRL